MAIRDWFGRKGKDAPMAPAAPPAAPRFPLDDARMFDLGATQKLAALFQQEGGKRDAAWQAAFWDNIWFASLSFAEPQVFAGPDGFPYLRLDLPQPGPFQAQCLADIAADCIGNGVGVAVFAGADHPPESAQYVISLGMLDSLLRYDSPDGDPVDLADMDRPGGQDMFRRSGEGGHEHMVVEQAHDVLIGSPSADYLPPHLARSLHKDLTSRWNVADPRVLILMDHHMRPTRSLMISVAMSDFPPDAPVADLVGALMWHIGPSRRIMLRPESQPVESMTRLVELFPEV